ncbi:hypothetical protein AB0B40_02270 [Streptomyces sp. NPDC042638]|uniref:hypothetical protein n=1 Tax=Streptomyces sp. NPDC042638 TaxID=3154333 RepID=UPI0033F0776E
MHAVSPFSGPGQGFDTLDPGFFVKAADALLDGLAEAGVGGLVAVGLGADRSTSGRRKGGSGPLENGPAGERTDGRTVGDGL